MAVTHCRMIVVLPAALVLALTGWARGAAVWPWPTRSAP